MRQLFGTVASTMIVCLIVRFVLSTSWLALDAVRTRLPHRRWTGSLALWHGRISQTRCQHGLTRASRLAPHLEHLLTPTACPRTGNRQSNLAPAPSRELPSPEM